MKFNTVGLEKAQELHGEAKFAAYSCLDATGTLEIFNRLRPRLNANQVRTYKWNLAQQTPAFIMGIRGVKVDTVGQKLALKDVTESLEKTADAIQANEWTIKFWDGVELETGFCPKSEKLTKTGKEQRHKWPRTAVGEPAVSQDEMRCERCGMPRLKPMRFQPASKDQCCHLLYERMKLPKKYGQTGSLTTDDDALEQLSHEKPKYSSLLELLREHRDLNKQRGFLSAKLSLRGRFHSGFNVSAPWTGRWSSSKNPYGEGGNLQNIAEKHRFIFVPDSGRKLCYVDLKTAESLLVAYIAGDEKYIEAHQRDVHTYVCREVWSEEIPWTGDLKKDKALAKNTYPPWDKTEGHDYRFQAKRVQHGSNYGLTPRGMAMIAKIPIVRCEEAQGRFFKAFPGIKEWQNQRLQDVYERKPIYNPLDREVRLLGRPNDTHTYKQALAFGPQSGVGDILNIGLWRLSQYDPELLEVLAQVHDAVLFQYRTEHEKEVLDILGGCMSVKVPVRDIHGKERECIIQVEAAIGSNWSKQSKSNPEGLVEIEL